MPVYLLVLIDKGERANPSRVERNERASILPKMADAYRAHERPEDGEITKFGTHLIESAREARDIANGRAEAAGAVTVESLDVKAIRRRLGLSQTGFAAEFGLSPGTVRDWEQSRRMPDRTARVLLQVIERNADAVRDAVRKYANTAE